MATFIKSFFATLFAVIIIAGVIGCNDHGASSDSDYKSLPLENVAEGGDCTSTENCVSGLVCLDGKCSKPVTVVVETPVSEDKTETKVGIFPSTLAAWIGSGFEQVPTDPDARELLELPRQVAGDELTDPAKKQAGIDKVIEWEKKEVPNVNSELFHK